MDWHYHTCLYRTVNTFHLGYENQSVYTVSGTSRCLFSDKHKTHKYSVGRAYSCWMLNWWCIMWPVGFKWLILTLYWRSSDCFIYRPSLYHTVRTFHLSYKNQSVYAVSCTSRCLFSDKYKTHKDSVGRAYSCWMLNWWCITWPVGFKCLSYVVSIFSLEILPYILLLSSGMLVAITIWYQQQEIQVLDLKTYFRGVQHVTQGVEGERRHNSTHSSAPCFFFVAMTPSEGLVKRQMYLNA
jgi:hypothetical protein